jgi:hypothetical protein
LLSSAVVGLGRLASGLGPRRKDNARDRGRAVRPLGAKLAAVRVDGRGGAVDGRGERQIRGLAAPEAAAAKPGACGRGRILFNPQKPAAIP